VQNLDCGLNGDYVLDERSANVNQRTGVTIRWRLSTVISANPPVIVISSTSDSEQSDPETQENVALKLIGMQLETSECLRTGCCSLPPKPLCIRAVSLDFVPSSLLVPYDILPSSSQGVSTPCVWDFCALMHLVLNLAARCTSTCPKLSCVCACKYSRTSEPVA